MEEAETTASIRTEDIWIPMADGMRLRARVWWPTALPAPAIMEQLPYRRTDFRSDRDERWYRHFAVHGYIGIRIDVRGTGDSEGYFSDEYSAAERDDAEAVVNWIAAQEWSDGTVGAIGISYSGFGALQLASRRPSALKAVIAAGFADDRFDQDVHRVGGTIHDVGLFWSQMLIALTSLPPYPDQVEDWQAQWLERLEGLPAPLTDWLEHQSKDDYWDSGSAVNHYADMTCPVYGVSGWADHYPDGVLSLLEKYPGPHKALIGPWEHAWPHEAGRGPRLDFASEAVRWFDHWLRGIDTGIMDEPRATVWIQQGAENPDPAVGRWVCPDSWPTHQKRLLGIKAETILDSPAPLAEDLIIDTPLSVGLHGGVSAPLLPGNEDQPDEQTPDDEQSVIFTSEPLNAPLELLGRPRLRVPVASNRPYGILAVRLTHVSPTEHSTLISTGLLSLPLAEDRRYAKTLEPGIPIEAVVDLMGTGYSIPAGHRLRLSLATGHWPWAWPTPGPFVLTIPNGATLELELPILDAEPAPENLPLLSRYVPPVETGTWKALAKAGVNSRVIQQDSVTGELARRSKVVLAGQPGNADGARFSFDIDETLGIREGDPTSARYDCLLVAGLERGSWAPNVRLESSLRSTETTFDLDISLTAKDGNQAIAQRLWSRRVPRDLL